MVQSWHDTMLKCVEDYKARKETGALKRWKLTGINPAPANKLINIK
jgi:hypothetical protein